MKFRSTWALLVIALIFGSYIYFIEIKKSAKDEELKSESEKVFALDADKIKGLKIKNANGSFDFEKDPKEGWKIKSPIVSLADETVMTGIVTGVSAERFDQVVSEGAETDLKTYGLDNPKEAVSLIGPDGVSKTVDIGSEGALSGKIYAMREGEKKVLFANTSLKTQIEKSLKDFRDKRVLRFSKDDVTSISISSNRADNALHLAMVKKSNVWQVTEPFSGKADEATVQALITTLEGLRATDFPSEEAQNPKKILSYGLNKPEFEVTLSDKDGKVLSKVLISPKKQGDTFAVVEGKPTIYQMFATSSDSLSHKADDFKDKKYPYEFDSSDIGEIIFKTEIVDLDLVKKSGNWQEKNPSTSGAKSGESARVVNQVQVNSLIDKLKSFKTSEFIKNETPKELAPPSGPKGSLTLKDAKGSLLIGYNWGEKTKSGKSYYIKTTKGSDVFGIDANAIDSLPGQTLLEDKVKNLATPTPPAGPTSPNATLPSHNLNPAFKKPGEK